MLVVATTTLSFLLRILTICLHPLATIFRNPLFISRLGAMIKGMVWLATIPTWALSSQRCAKYSSGADFMGDSRCHSCWDCCSTELQLPTEHVLLPWSQAGTDDDFLLMTLPLPPEAYVWKESWTVPPSRESSSATSQLVFPVATLLLQLGGYTQTGVPSVQEPHFHTGSDVTLCSKRASRSWPMPQWCPNSTQKAYCTTFMQRSPHHESKHPSFHIQASAPPSSP